MAALRKAKDERFVHLVADGKSGTDAYLEAGHKVSRKAAGVSACRLLKRANIKARLEEILTGRATVDAQATAKALDRLAITKERVLAEVGASLSAEHRSACRTGPRSPSGKRPEPRSPCRPFRRRTASPGRKP